MAPKSNEQLKNELEEAKAREAALQEQIDEMEVPEIVDGQTPSGIKVMTAEEYGKYSKENGRIMGRLPNQKTVCSIEELRALINSNWTPSMVMEKHGIDAEELKQLVWKLSKRELRDKPIKYSIERDFFVKEG